MPKLGMQSIRRRQLIDATLEAINEVGMHDATIAQIARRAGFDWFLTQKISSITCTSAGQCRAAITGDCWRKLR